MTSEESKKNPNNNLSTEKDFLEVNDEFFEVNIKTESSPLRGRAAFTGDPVDEKNSFSPKRQLNNDSFLRNNPASGNLEYKDPDDKKRILIVEDDLDQSNVLEVVFKSVDYKVNIAHNGLEGLTQLEKEKTDLIVCDLMMPKMNGAEFVARVRCDPRFWNIPILILTVMSDPDKEFALLNIGADDYCEKTVQKKILLKRVENLLNKINLRN